MQASVGDRVVALASAGDVFRREGVVAEQLAGGLARVELDDGGEELIGSLAGRVVELGSGARVCESFARAGWYVVVGAEVAA